MVSSHHFLPSMGAVGRSNHYLSLRVLLPPECTCTLAQDHGTHAVGKCAKQRLYGSLFRSKLGIGNHLTNHLHTRTTAAIMHSLQHLGAHSLTQSSTLLTHPFTHSHITLSYPLIQLLINLLYKISQPSSWSSTYLAPAYTPRPRGPHATPLPHPPAGAREAPRTSASRLPPPPSPPQPPARRTP